jgi:tRNA threonylcarbamoyladenosine biosynthesis protein TsaB
VKVLGIETATIECSVALVEDHRVRAERSISAPHIHSEKLIPLIDEVLASEQLSPGDIDGIGISIGPGSFTGLRIGLSVAKGLAFAVSKPIAAVPTLEALAYNTRIHGSAGKESAILPMIDARRNEVYCALYYNRETDLVEHLSARVLVLPEILEMTGDVAEITVVGDGAVKFEQFLLTAKQIDRKRFYFPGVHRRRCSAESVALLAEQQLTGGRTSDLASLEPMYVKEFYTLVKTQHSSVH